MARRYLATTALASLLIFPATSHAQLEATISGFADFQTGYASQEDAFSTGTLGRDYHFQNDTEIHVTLQGTADNGLTYGAKIELEADVTADPDDPRSNNNADKTYLFLESGFGRLELGNNAGVEHLLKVDASTIARATGGADGDFYDFIDFNGLSNSAFFIITPDLPPQHTLGLREDATKVSYLTPIYSGFQAGVSFTPDDGDGGTAAQFTGDANGDQENTSVSA